jgi:hypothetical protein
MTLLRRRSTITLGLLFFSSALAFSQALPPSESEAIRVNVTVNADGSRTAYEFDQSHRKATATTRESDGKLRSKINYQLDDAGRFASGLVFDPEGKLLFKSAYKYDSAGRMEEETQLGQDGKVRNKIVYGYDAAGKQTGYSTFDEKGKLISHVDAPSTAPTPTSRK